MDITGVTEHTVYNWKRKIKQGGIDALNVKNHGGALPKLNELQTEELKTILQTGAIAYGFQNDRWCAKQIAQVIKEKFNVEYHHRYIPRLMQRLGYSYQKPTTQSQKRSQEKIEHWRKYTLRKIKKRQKMTA
ncbi:hypothetical protein AGMMS50229_18900 [Campylobacterota bacterium]|nr:hypothetical protein AGMMS50229_18900 [Campylobacterota bacterium]